MGLLLAVSVNGCDAGGGASGPISTTPSPPPETAPPPSAEPEPPPLPTEPPPAPPISYELQASALLTDWGALSRPSFGNAVAFGDFDGDGDEDTFFAQVSSTEAERFVHSMEPAPVAMYLNEGEAGFRLSDGIFVGRVPRVVHPRKALPGDFNGDGRLDIFVAATGYDKPPFPGEPPVLMLSTERGLQEASGLEHLIGFHHGAASADVDYDGDLDILVTDSGSLNRPIGDNGPFLLLNDGHGAFAFDQSRLPAEVVGSYFIYTAELIDVDGDLWPDLLLAGHEFSGRFDGRPTTIYWGSPTGTWEDSRKTVLPAVEGHGIVVDIDAEDLDGDGLREIILNRTSEEPRYSSFYIQILSGQGGREFADETERRIEGGVRLDLRPGQWLDWLRVIDLNGDGALDIFVDDLIDHGLHWLNDGSGRLRLGPESR